MQLTSKRIAAINDLLRSEGFTPDEIMVGVTAVIVSKDAVEDPIALVRGVAREHRKKRVEASVVADEVKLYPCGECKGSGWVFVTRGFTVGGSRIEPGQSAQAAGARCGVCHGTRFVLAETSEEERITLAEFLARHPGHEWGSTQPGPPAALSALGGARPSASEVEPEMGPLLLP